MISKFVSNLRNELSKPSVLMLFFCLKVTTKWRYRALNSRSQALRSPLRLRTFLKSACQTSLLESLDSRLVSTVSNATRYRSL